VLSARAITRSFGSVRALDCVDLDVQPGEVHALLGENGAGKSTLIRILSGALTADHGTVELAGVPVAPRSPREAERLGIACVHQEVHLIPDLTVADNILLAREPTRCGMRLVRRAHRQANKALARIGAAIDGRAVVRDLTTAQRQLVAIARSLDVEARVLILDEPTSSLDAEEVRRLLSLLRELRAEGMAIVLISHFLDQVEAVADRLTILRDGRLVRTALARELSRGELVRLMVGREVTGEGRAAPQEARGAERESSSVPARTDPVVLSASGLAVRSSLAHFDLEVRAGECIGLAGLLGSGRTEALRALFGLTPATGGSIFIDGAPVRIDHPRAAIAHGLAMTPEDRRHEALVPSLSIAENIVLAMQIRQGVRRRIPPAVQRRLAEEMIRSLRIACRGPDQPVSELSGGNQQKVVLARWLIIRPRVLLLDEPTRGIDVGAREEIESLIDELRRAGASVILVTAELDHLARSSHRLVVMRDRRSVRTLTGGAVCVEAILDTIAEGAPDAAS